MTIADEARKIADSSDKIKIAFDYAVFIILVVAIASIVPIGTCIAIWMLFKAAKNY